MSVMLRLSRRGQANRPVYRIVAADKAAKRDGRFLEIVGTYNTGTNPPTLVLKEERVKHWVSVGAQSSILVRSLINSKIPGLIEGREKHQLEKIRARRKKRKQGAKKSKK